MLILFHQVTILEFIPNRLDRATPGFLQVTGVPLNAGSTMDRADRIVLRWTVFNFPIYTDAQLQIVQTVDSTGQNVTDISLRVPIPSLFGLAPGFVQATVDISLNWQIFAGDLVGGAPQFVFYEPLQGLLFDPC